MIITVSKLSSNKLYSFNQLKEDLEKLSKTHNIILDNIWIF